jgi:hypothetical protein
MNDSASHPKMSFISNSLTTSFESVNKQLPYLHIYASDKLCSSILISGSLEPKEQWLHGIFENSKYFRISIMCKENKRFYEENDLVTCELITSHHALKKFRKCSATPEKIIAKIVEYVKLIQNA